MMHPHTRLGHIDDSIGYGVFATRPIPAGTIVWAMDPLDRVVLPEEMDALPPMVREAALKYMFRDGRGRYVLCWDHARYVNHSFFPTSMLTPWPFDIAIRDIPAGGQITGDYGMLNIIEPFEPFPEDGAERRLVSPDDLRIHHAAWDAELRRAAPLALRVPQPLKDAADASAWEAAMRAFRGETPIPSLAICHFAG